MTGQSARAAVRVEPVRALAADLGPENPLPRFTPMRALPPMDVDPLAPSDMVERVRFGRMSSPLPCAVHDGYSREVSETEFEAVVLENEALRAVVVPALGARLWSLYDKQRDRELLYVAPRVQWANFGLTGAWFAGGSEWNIGSTGHTTLSARPWHAGVVRRSDGDVLRLWEWERTRDLIVQIDLWIEPGADRLNVSTVVRNPDPEPKPLYWWTTIAVPETEHTRVLAPGDFAWRTDYDGRLMRVDVPHPDSPDVDVSFPRVSDRAADYFYGCEAVDGRWVASVEPDGRGFAQTSTAALRGRKLFLWGDGPGGRRWQRWLSGGSERYLEIQAGWCPTQMEHDVIGPSQEVAWTESFSALDLTPEEASGGYREACAAAERAVHAVPPEVLEQAHRRWLGEVAPLPPDEIVAQGSGWGSVETRLRDQDGPATGPAFGPVPVPWPAVDDDSRAAAAALDGDYESASTLSVPPISQRWRERLSSDDRHWWTAYALGVIAQARGDLSEADAQYAESLARQETGWAHRCRALVAGACNEPERAFYHYERATEALPQLRSLGDEYAQLLLANGKPEAALDVLARLPEVDRQHGRTQLLVAQANLALGRRDAAEQFLRSAQIADLAEGELVLSELWAAVYPDRPLPDELNFEMTQRNRS